MKLTLVAAVSENGVIGSQNSLPWYIPEDLKHFKRVTEGKTVLMGRNTFDSIMARLKKPLPNRTNIVVSRSADFVTPEGVKVYKTLEEALETLKDLDEVMVIGGGQIYTQTIDKADKLIITEVHKEIDGDVFFPRIDKTIWKKTEEEPHDGFSFVVYEK